MEIGSVLHIKVTGRPSTCQEDLKCLTTFAMQWNEEHSNECKPFRLSLTTIHRVLHEFLHKLFMETRICKVKFDTTRMYIYIWWRIFICCCLWFSRSACIGDRTCPFEYLHNLYHSVVCYCVLCVTLKVCIRWSVEPLQANRIMSIRSFFFSFICFQSVHLPEK